MEEISVLTQVEDLDDVAAIIGVAVLACLYLFLRYRNRRDLQATFRAAIERGVPLSPETLAAMGLGPRGANADLRAGVFCLATSLGFLLLGFLSTDSGVLDRLLGSAGLLAVLGIAFLGLWRYGYGRKR